MGVDVTQRNATRNQSTADYEQKKIFLFDNRFSTGTVKNAADPAATQTLKAGQLLFRASDGTLSITGAYSALVGVLAIDGSVDLASAATLTVTYCDKGTVNANALVLPGTDTLNTVTSGLTVKDYLNNIGLHIDTSIVEMTGFDN